jgi:hypothetical protein
MNYNVDWLPMLQKLTMAAPSLQPLFARFQVFNHCLLMETKTPLPGLQSLLLLETKTRLGCTASTIRFIENGVSD